MHVSLTKHHGLGNDFLVYDMAQGDQSNWSQLAQRWCERSTGVGADGLLLLTIVDNKTLGMRLYNADGSIAEMSGNGIRCLVQAAHFTLEGVSGTVYDVSTDAGTREAVVTSEWDDDTIHISVDMGYVEDLDEPKNWESLQCDPLRPVRHVSLGNPHSVVGVEEVAVVDLTHLGSLVPHINLEVIEQGPESNAITMRVHERGAGITRACGTGACAAADAALAWGLVPQSVEHVVVHMDGGDARVRISNDRRATLIGPAVFVARVLVHA